MDWLHLVFIEGLLHGRVQGEVVIGGFVKLWVDWVESWELFLGTEKGVHFLVVLHAFRGTGSGGCELNVCKLELCLEKERRLVVLDEKEVKRWHLCLWSDELIVVEAVDREEVHSTVLHSVSLHET